MQEKDVGSLRSLVVTYNEANKAKKEAEARVALLKDSILSAAPKENMEKRVTSGEGHLVISITRNQTRSMGYDFDKYIQLLESKKLNKEEYIKYKPEIDLDKFAVLVESEIISEKEFLALEIKSKPFDVVKVTEYDYEGKVVKT